MAKLFQARCPSCRTTNIVKALKDDSVTDCRQHATTMLPWLARNTVVAELFTDQMPSLFPSFKLQH